MDTLYTSNLVLSIALSFNQKQPFIWAVFVLVACRLSLYFTLVLYSLPQTSNHFFGVLYPA